jgi:hypothetical protein
MYKDNSLKHGGLELAPLVPDIPIVAEPQGEEALETAAPGLKEPPLLKGLLKLPDLLDKATPPSQRTGVEEVIVIRSRSVFYSIKQAGVAEVL